MRSLALFIILSGLGGLLAVGGTLAAVSRCGALSAEQRARLVEELDRAASGWEALKTPAEARRVIFFVGGEPDGVLLEPPASPPAVATALWALLRSGARRAEHERRLSELVAPGAFVSDWYQEGVLWADEKRRRQDALAIAVGKARRAGARVILVSDALGVEDTVRALKSAPVSSADEALVDRLIAVGAGEFPDTPRAAEPVSIWHSEGDSVTPAGTQFRLRDAAGRLRQQTLEGEAATEAGAARLVQQLTAGASPADALKSVGQALAAPAAPLVSSQPSAPSAGAGRPVAKPKAGEASGPLASVAAESAKSVARPGSVPGGWTPARIQGPMGPIGWTIASPNEELAPRFDGSSTCADEKALKTASADALKAGCHVLICLELRQDKTVNDVVSETEPGRHVDRYQRDDGSEGKLISKITPSVQFGHGAWFFVKSRGQEGRWLAKDVYHYAIDAKPYLLDLRYEVSGSDPVACGRPYFDVYDKAAHSIAPER